MIYEEPKVERWLFLLFKNGRNSHKVLFPRYRAADTVSLYLIVDELSCFLLRVQFKILKIGLMLLAVTEMTLDYLEINFK